MILTQFDPYFTGDIFAVGVVCRFDQFPGLWCQPLYDRVGDGAGLAVVRPVAQHQHAAAAVGGCTCLGKKR